MVNEDIWDLFFYVGQPDHLAIAEGVAWQPQDPLAYANELLSDCELPVLTVEEFRGGVRRLVRAGALVREGRALRLSPAGKEALEMNFHWPRKGQAAQSPPSHK